jgi:hypothetical protein
MAAGEPQAVFPEPAYDLGLDENRGASSPGENRSAGAGDPLTFSAQDVLRALILGEVIDEPRGRRGRPPHRKS